MEGLELKIDSVFWSQKKVLITGHTGFKGAWLAYWLWLRGAVVKGYSLAPDSVPNLYQILQLQNKMVSVYGDICNFEKLQQEIGEFEPDIVFHFAAQSLVRESYRSPRDTFLTNIIGTANVIEAARQLPKVPCLIIATTDKCYENKESGLPFKEGEPLGGNDPYSASKAGAELVTHSYNASFFAKNKDSRGLASVRAGNVIGGGDWSKDRLVPDFVRAISAGKAVQIRSPQAVRPWQHVLEALSGYLRIAEKTYLQPTTLSRAWNLGPNQGSDISVREFLDKFVSRWGASARWEKEADDLNPYHEATLLKLNIQDVANHLSWSPKLNIDHAITMTVDWYKSWIAGEDMAQVTKAQISNYEN